jgi:RNA polymerase primary sigma factor
MLAQSTIQADPPPECGTARLAPAARARRILGTRLTYVDHPTFEDPTAREEILAPLTLTDDDSASHQSQTPKRRAALPADRSGGSFLSREQEAHLFRKMNYLKRRACQLKKKLDPNWPSPQKLDEIERLQTEALALKHRIVESHLRLVISIARTYVKSGHDLSECVSDGNLALIQAVDGFDFSRGYRFSTYATWVIRHMLARQEQRARARRTRNLTHPEQHLRAHHFGNHDCEQEEVQHQWRSMVSDWLGRLEMRERCILASRYGIGRASERTLKEIGQELGISKERVRQIAARASAKLREFARLEAFEL